MNEYLPHHFVGSYLATGYLFVSSLFCVYFALIMHVASKLKRINVF